MATSGDEGKSAPTLAPGLYLGGYQSRNSLIDFSVDIRYELKNEADGSLTLKRESHGDSSGGEFSGVVGQWSGTDGVLVDPKPSNVKSMRIADDLVVLTAVEEDSDGGKAPRDISLRLRTPE